MLVSVVSGYYGMPPLDAKLRAGDYRDKAVALRRLARYAHMPEVRAQLLILADRFDRLADHVEAWESERAAAN